MSPNSIDVTFKLQVLLVELLWNTELVSSGVGVSGQSSISSTSVKGHFKMAHNGQPIVSKNATNLPMNPIALAS
jgi:hypothetical protein